MPRQAKNVHPNEPPESRAARESGAATREAADKPAKSDSRRDVLEFVGKIAAAIIAGIFLIISVRLASPPPTPAASPPVPASTVSPPTPTPSALPSLTPLSTIWPPVQAVTCADSNALGRAIASPAPQSGRATAIALHFEVNAGGSSCWKIPLHGYSASAKNTLTLWVKGDKGGEEYEVGIKLGGSPVGQDLKVSETASPAWSQVKILLDGFGDQDLSSLANVSLNFVKVGSGTIYVDEIAFLP